jgi:hypothetical protein
MEITDPKIKFKIVRNVNLPPNFVRGVHKGLCVFHTDTKLMQIANLVQVKIRYNFWHS